MNLRPYILHEEPDFLVLNKPAGLLTIPDRFDPDIPAASRILEQHYGPIYVVHRLDRMTSGVLLFARNEKAHKFLSEKFQSRDIQKTYLGLCMGHFQEPIGSISLPLEEHPAKKGKMQIARKGKPALTDYEVLESFQLYSFVRIRIHTGKTHQIRVHMQSLGHPIAMDELYGDDQPFYLSSIKRRYHLGKHQDEERPLMARLALHAFQLEFEDEKGQKRQFEAPLPKDFSAVLQQLRKHASTAGL